MENIRPFQIGLLVAFALIALVSIILLASYQGFGGASSSPYGSKVEIWGTLDQNAFTRVIQELAREDRGLLAVQYVQKDSRTFETELVNAIAEGRSPDAILINHELLVTLRSKLQAIPYDVFSQRSLRDNYLDGFEIFARTDGLYAIPFAVDPLIMYWNRDLLAAGGFSQPPATWESLTSMVERLTLRDATRNISQATVAFGEYQNVINAKPLLLTLLLQSGSRMVEEGQDRYLVALDSAVGDTGRRPLNSTLQFYIEFSNPASPLYSWNRTFQSDQSAFLSERLALYFGYGSEAGRLSSQNPNLNFDATAIPQGAGATVKRVYGKFYGFAIPQASQNPQGAYRAVLVLGSAAATAGLTDSLSLAPAHRSTISGGASDATREVIFNQSLISRGWLDPGPEKSNEAFSTTISDIASGRTQIGTASSDTIRRLELAF